jgi:hypothetical protein
MVLAKYVTLDDAGLAGLADVGDATGQNGISVVGAAVPGQEADEALGLVRPTRYFRSGGVGSTYREGGHSEFPVIDLKGLECKQ